jgi:hypothetical protein
MRRQKMPFIQTGCRPLYEFTYPFSLVIIIVNYGHRLNQLQVRIDMDARTYKEAVCDRPRTAALFI